LTRTFNLVSNIVYFFIYIYIKKYMSYHDVKPSTGFFGVLKKEYNRFTRKRRENRYKRKILAIRKKIMKTQKLLKSLENQEKNIIFNYEQDLELDNVGDHYEELLHNNSLKSK